MKMMNDMMKINGELDDMGMAMSLNQMDMNVVMLQPINGGEPTYVEVQGTAEGKAFSRSELDALLGLAAGGLEQIFAKQREVIATPPTPRPLGR